MISVEIEGNTIGDGFPCYMIAEIGGNFLQFSEAKHLIDLAKNAGADAVKLQTYRAETIAAKSAVYDMPNVGAANQFDLFKQYEVDLELHKEIWDYCKSLGITIFSTPSHVTDVELLEQVDCAAYKIGSDDAVNIPFLKEVASFGKPIILSTGMCTLQEVGESVSAILGTGNTDLVLLHCVTNYPTSAEHCNLKCIERMKQEFGLPVGFSDHTLGTACCIGAGALGANVLEKHFTHDKEADGPDHMLSATPEEFAEIVTYTRQIEAALGDGVKRPARDEKKTRINNRKSIVTTCHIEAGQVITKEMLAIKRPGFGIPPKYFDEIVGRTAKSAIEAEVPVRWDDV